MRKQVFSIILTLALVALALPPWSFAQGQTTASGHWEGSIDVQGTVMEISVDLLRAENGAWKGTIAIPSQSLKDYPLSNLKVEGVTVSFEMASVEGLPTFKGKLSPDGKAMIGEVTQSGLTFPFKLERKGEAQMSTTDTKAASITVSPDVAGDWHGTLDAEGTLLRLILKIAKAADGSFTASLDSPDQGQSNMPINSLTTAGDSITFAMKYIGAVYQGKFNKERSEMAGEWTQGGRSLPLTLKRAAKKP